jgi:branched-chain amino acid transport system substrate-binding protein
VITGNWGNDLMLLVKAAREAGYEGASTPSTAMPWELRRPWAMPAWAGAGRADWLPNVPRPSRAFYQSFRQRFPRPQDDYVHMRMQLMIEALAQSLEKAGSTDTVAVAHALEHARVQLAGRSGSMRAADHQFQQSLVVGMMEKEVAQAWTSMWKARATASR